MLLAASFALGIMSVLNISTIEVDEVKYAGTVKPNVLVLSTDGLDAANMSAYGYRRKTTPFIDSLVPQSLLIQNHFTFIDGIPFFAQ